VLERPGDWENEGRRRWMRDVGLGFAAVIYSRRGTHRVSGMG
jgi:hypothetical protein